MAQTVALLEEALRAWEDCCFIEEAIRRASINVKVEKPEDLAGPARHWREFRNHLLMLKGGDFDLRRFYNSSTLGYHIYNTLPLQLASWTLSSRRVFKVSAELADKFGSADYEGLTWSDLLWPFDAFAIEFEEPISLDGVTTGLKLNMLLVTSVFDVCPTHSLAIQDGFEVRAFLTGEDAGTTGVEILSQKDREILEKRIRQKQWSKLSNLVVRHNENLATRLRSGGLPTGWVDPISIVKSGEIDLDYANKCVAGLCLYLEALPSGSVEGAEWQQRFPKLRREVRGIITEGEQVCRVESFHSLSPDTLARFPQKPHKGPAFTVTPHWRRAHYRRPKGQGKNPNAPRTVKIEALLVHKDQLPDGTLPGGAVSKVKV